MFDKLQAYYCDSLLLAEKPNFSYYSGFHWFKDDSSSQWLGIPFGAIHKKELLLLKSLFQYESNSFAIHPKVQKWHDFLYNNGEIPISENDTNNRFILFHLFGKEWERDGLEEAMYGFFRDEAIILWEGHEFGIIIEQNSEPKEDESLFLSLSQTLESDFFIKAYFYSGKIQPLSKEWPAKIKEAQGFFEQAIKLIPSQVFHTFERSLPFILSHQMPKKIRNWLQSEILKKIADEPELLMTVKRFLENNSNVTLTAKELYIHRNTLQYRLDKFAQKTGVNFKDFNSTITVYLSCLLFKNEGN
ncbi:CdaR family transcriptional regulator [Bacillus sp. S/N-304-OC-R1]|uniref:PucR family transcriptional regulator n=1 Tax=Bacillus sp. S/N-304-OC-R1 TaxID=2758034 RepID=UPI001C8DD486|nr:helix-turn-helix domain-containing protein [Bacillus sp. S/N-304-OC-R1]MBY0121830.1 helix-turn-helix domain-containing protein [Bacillus sp. S/N-304-OC-R1]